VLTLGDINVYRQGALVEANSCELNSVIIMSLWRENKVAIVKSQNSKDLISKDPNSF